MDTPNVIAGDWKRCCTASFRKGDTYGVNCNEVLTPYCNEVLPPQFISF
ncbi:hypothetical protein [Rickettsia endosymbiont of Orchestes rusci]